MHKSDLLWALYLSEREFIQHHEVQRTNASNILTAIAAGLIVALGTDKLNVMIELAIAILLVVIGVFGLVFCRKLSELMSLHALRSYKYLEELDTEVADVKIEKIKNDVKLEHVKKHPRISKLRLSNIWVFFHLSILCAGTGFLVIYLADLL